MMRSLIAMWLLTGGLSAQTLAQYDRITALLSEPVQTRWTRFGSVYFRTNERLLNRFYPRFDHAGGVIVGVSFQQNLSLLVHARPDLCVIFDINPAVTEILTPLIGHWMALSPARRDFISKWLAVDAGPEDTKRLLEGRNPGEVYTELLKKTPPDRRAHLQRDWRAAMEKILDRLPLTAQQRKEALDWQNVLDRDEYPAGEFFQDSIGGNGWLSTEENYQLVRKYWMTGRIIGVTGDIGGPSVAKLAAWLRKSKKQVSVIYLSDVGTALTGPGTPAHFSKLYETLGALPMQSGARVLISHGGVLTAYSRTYAGAVWLYRYLSGVDYSTFFRLNQNVLQSVTANGPKELIPSLQQEFRRLVEDKARRNAPLSPESVVLYTQLLNRVVTDLSQLKTLDLAGFTRWIHASLPLLDANDSVVLTVGATLAEAGALRTQ